MSKKQWNLPVTVLQDKADLAARLKVKNKDKEDKILLKEFLKSTMFGKLSKRDGDRLGFPVFPLSWNIGNGVDAFRGFDEFGFLPDALINFLAFLGWILVRKERFFRWQNWLKSLILAV
ncbi:MAG: hypothetical protein HC803_08835 [Saprospiraceae bacterium]|nr:hypothetical protein [Saprospiraceae bacterium]